LLGSNLSDRTDIWAAIIRRGFDLTGIGAGASQVFIGQAIGVQYVAHNVFLGVLLETGLLGMMLFLFVLLKAGLDGLHSPYQELLIFMVPVLAVCSLALSLEVRRSFWLVVALTWVTRPKANMGSKELQ
jgi:O-antigen ligase